MVLLKGRQSIYLKSTCLCYKCVCKRYTSFETLFIVILNAPRRPLFDHHHKTFLLSGVVLPAVVFVSYMIDRFSPTCLLDDDGWPTCDACPVGYIGRRCEQCDSGYTGNPMEPGNFCKPECKSFSKSQQQFMICTTLLHKR